VVDVTLTGTLGRVDPRQVLETLANRSALFHTHPGFPVALVRPIGPPAGDSVQSRGLIDAMASSKARTAVRVGYVHQGGRHHVQD
jgi:hypothetical protein